MSRTRRYIPLWARLLRLRNGQSCVCGEVYFESERFMRRNALLNGRDWAQQSSVRHGESGYDRDVYTGDSRRFYKKQFHSRRRDADKAYLRVWFKEYE